MLAQGHLRKGSIYAILFVIVIVIIGTLAYIIRMGGGSLPVSGQAPDFSATNVNGKPFQFSNLDGKIRLVTWFYTRCPDECPLTAFRMSQIQTALEKKGEFGSKVDFVSMTINPQYDTQPVIQKWSEHFHANYNGWYIVNASPDHTNDILKSWNIQAKVSEDPEKIEHVLKTELIDGNGNIRAVYNSADLDVNQIEKDIQSLISRSNWSV